MNAITKIATERRTGSRALDDPSASRKQTASPDIRNIVVIDDVATNVALLSATLCKLENVAVFGFSNAREALAHCRLTAADLIFVDYQMPEMDGVAFIKQFRELPGNALVPIVVVTGEDEAGLLSLALDAGAQDFLRKPVDRVELSARARSMLRLSDASKQLARFAAIDELTGLANRRSFLSHAAEALIKSPPAATMSIAIFDIDFFKSVNDRFGHPGGDAVLREVALRLRCAVSLSNVWGRLGGEEFGLLMPQSSSATDARVLCERARQAVLSLPIAVSLGVRVDVTLSGGIATSLPGDDPLQWLARADRALYDAKRSGRNCLRIVA